MIAPLKLAMEDVTKLTDRAEEVFYEHGSTFLTTKAKLLTCKLDSNQRETVQSFPKIVKLVTVELGTFNIDL